MSVNERFVRLSHFLQHVLPGLARGTSLTHLVATYHWIGTRPPIMPTEIVVDDGLKQILLHELNAERIMVELPELLREQVDPEVPLLATIYAGRSGFLSMLAVAKLVRTVHPSAQIVIANCGHLSEDEECMLRRGIEAGVITHVVWVECGGSQALGLIRDAVVETCDGLDVLAVRDADASPSLGA